MEDRNHIPELVWMRMAAASQPRPAWSGDLADDCTARWAGLTLRAECMEDGIWWWSVYLDSQDLEVASSLDVDAVFATGEDARKAAELAALAFLGLPGNTLYE